MLEMKENTGRTRRSASADRQRDGRMELA